MNVQVMSPLSIQQVVAKIFATRRITRIDQQLILSLTNLNSEEQALLDEVSKRLRRGLLRVAD